MDKSLAIDTNDADDEVARQLQALAHGADPRQADPFE
jgi:hypothetical protein